MRRFLHARSGVAALEFALLLPLLILLLIGAAEIINYLTLQQRLARAAHGMAAAAAEGRNVSQSELDMLATALPDMMWPYAQPVSVTFSGVLDSTAPGPALCNTGGAPCILWQYGVGGNISRFGTPGAAVDMPGLGTAALAEQNYIIAEVWMPYAPLLPIGAFTPSGLASITLYAYAVHKPLQGAGLVLEP